MPPPTVQPEAAAQNSITLALPTDGKEVQANVILTSANALKVTNADEYNAAASFLQQIKANAAEVEKERVEWKKPLDSLSKKVQALFKPALDTYTTAEAIVKRKLIAYMDEQERIRRAAQAKADEEARIQQQKLADQAAKAAKAGKIEKAEALEQRAASVVAPVIQHSAPKVAGIQPRKQWVFEIVDASLVPREYLVVDEKKIGAVVRALKGNTNIPGVKVREESNLAAAGAA